jgi:hypothetical protein
MIFIGILSFIFYFLASFNKKLRAKVFFTFLFLITSVFFRLLVTNDQLPDYDSYYSVIGKIDPEFTFKILFTEPYYFQLVNYLYKSFSAELSINVFYSINFLVTTFFFVWLLFIKDIPAWKKVLLFSLYYYVFTFILLRNTISYILIGYLFYWINYKKVNKISFFAMFSHLSSLPALFSSLFKNRRGDFKLIVLMGLYIFAFSFILKLEVLNLYEKFSVYQDSQNATFSIFHRMYFIFFIIINFILFLFKRHLFFNYTYLPIFITYLILQYTNPVMGYRFSIYLVLYLLFYNMGIKTGTNRSRQLNLLSFVFLFFFLLGFKSIFP